MACSGLWENGPPTKPGLYVIEWMNCGGLATFIVFTRDGGRTLFAWDVDWDHPHRQPVQIRRWSISRHLEIPRPERADEINFPATYERSDAGFNINVGQWGQNAKEIEESMALLEQAFGAYKGAHESE